ncbi:hypothetical protein J5226_24055 [Lysobacter sp. K5869]|uniref:hypothetical protein n=1 Tax=Lysobacter sp. K5869 TaxID=2820808 RepID=UPI001C0613FB|nr:hypothetical protein [Lysobacter sp. K5869]QWP76612.1 hypothetical protein J5226_24055 [Lysobacter sp. K5869]
MHRTEFVALVAESRFSCFPRMPNGTRDEDIRDDLRDSVRIAAYAKGRDDHPQTPPLFARR